MHDSIAKKKRKHFQFYSNFVGFSRILKMFQINDPEKTCTKFLNSELIIIVIFDHHQQHNLIKIL